MWRRLPCITLVLLLCLAFSAQAHRVNVFAWPEGDTIQVDCGFSRSQKVKHGALVFTDAATGDVLLEALTDEKGAYSFRPSAAFLATGHGLHIRLNAGEGHSSDWDVSPEELRTLVRSEVEANGTQMWAPPTPARALPALDPANEGRKGAGEAAGMSGQGGAGTAPVAPDAAQRPNATQTPDVAQSTAACLTPQAVAELERVVSRVVDARLAPLTATLARQQDSGPGLRDIIGGIGWIFGLLGIATYMKYRR